MTIATLPATTRVKIIRDMMIRERGMRDRVFSTNHQKRREKVGEMDDCLLHLDEIEKELRAK